MNLQELKPGLSLADPENDLPELLGHMLTKLQFVPNIRHALGWRGLVPSQRFAHTWTARVDGRPGIFGVLLDAVQVNDEDWAQATYRIVYFPDPDETVCQRFSPVARDFMARENYLETIREFATDPDMAALFEVGRFTLTADRGCNTLVLGLNGLARRQISIEKGVVHADQRDQSSSVVECLPAFTMAFQLFRVLAASVAYVVGEAPLQLSRKSFPGWRYLITADGRWQEQPDRAHNFYDLRLGYGQTHEGLPAFQATNEPPVERTISWRAPEPPPTLFADALWWRAHDLETLSTIDKRSLGIEDRPQLFVLSGFLGSGKTTFLQNFIEYQLQHHRFVAVIQNEIGETSVDARILDDAYAVTELNDGAVCCSLVGELRPALQRILNNFHPDVIVIETSGVANPLGMQTDIRALEDLVRFDSVTTIVDAEHFDRVRTGFDVADDQVRAADVIVLNKADLVTNRRLQIVEKTLRSINSNAMIIRASHGDINPGLLYDFNLEAGETRLKDDPIDTPTHCHDTLTSYKIDYSMHVHTQRFVELLENVPPSVFRIKGVIDLVGRGPTLVQFVGGRFNLSDFKNSHAPERFLVLIGHELEHVAEAFRSLGDIRIAG